MAILSLILLMTMIIQFIHGTGMPYATSLMIKYLDGRGAILDGFIKA